jgi:mannose/cellobiose epimerase-like protein (N-acyl-D-glucosamine 2-epimerase family)
MRRTNSHMHPPEAFLAWPTETGERRDLQRATLIIGLFRSHFLDLDTWLYSWPPRC